MDTWHCPKLLHAVKQAMQAFSIDQLLHLLVLSHARTIWHLFHPMQRTALVVRLLTKFESRLYLIGGSFSGSLVSAA